MKTGFLSDYQVILLLLNGPQMLNRSMSIIYDVRKWRHFDFALTSITGQSVAHNRQNMFLFGLLVKREHILAFYKSNFRL